MICVPERQKKQVHLRLEVHWARNDKSFFLLILPQHAAAAPDGNNSEWISAFPPSLFVHVMIDSAYYSCEVVANWVGSWVGGSDR